MERDTVYTQYNYEDFRVAWKRFPVKGNRLISKFHTKKVYLEDEESSFENLFFLSHFCLSGHADIKCYAPNCSIASRHNSLFLQKDKTIEINIAKDYNEEYSLFEYSFSEEYFFENFIEESLILRKLLNKYDRFSLAWAGENLSTTPEMKLLVLDIMHSPFTGKMQEMYLNSKITQLLLLQIKDFDSSVSIPRLITYDEERIRYIKEYIDENIGKELDLAMLSHLAGINRTKLKNGFRQLFGTPVYKYIIDQRMNMARHLLSSQDSSVSEIATKIGYSDISHFSNAFKLRFGFPPSTLRK